MVVVYAISEPILVNVLRIGVKICTWLFVPCFKWRYMVMDEQHHSGIFLPVTRVKHHRDYTEIEHESRRKRAISFTVIIDEV